MAGLRRIQSFSVVLLGSIVMAVLSACGGGASITRSGTGTSGGFDVQVSAGAPVSGATITVFAIGDASGEVNTSAGESGVIGIGGPTDSAGHAAVTLTAKAYSGPIQVVVSGAAMTYQDPTAVAVAGQAPPMVRIPASFVLSSFLPQWKLGAEGTTVPVSFFTTLADHEALAFMRGKHPGHTGTCTLSAALAGRDGLFVAHITTSSHAWDPASLRTTVPATLASSTTTLVDTAFAALFDLALNQLARDTAAKAGYGSDSAALTASTLAQLLEEDLDADGQFDGRGLGGRTLSTLGASPVVLDAQFLRVPLAQALDGWIRNAGVNESGLRQADLVGARVYAAMTQDSSDLFGGPPVGTFDPVDREAPRIALVSEPPQYTNAATLTLTVSATDATGVKGVYAMVGSQQFGGHQQADGTWQVGVNLPLQGHNIITVWAEDTVIPTANSGFGGDAAHQLARDVLRDSTPPTASYDANFASYQDERTLTLNTDAKGIALVPASYAVGPRTSVPLGGEIWKAATRLAGGADVSASELETANAQNIPVLRFVVQANAATDSPITRASFRVQLACSSPCPTTPDAAGQLLPSPSTDVQHAAFDLPLSVEVVPLLATVQGTARLSVTLDLADAAGNTATLTGFDFTFHLLGPPLAIAEDAEYSAAGKLDSTYPYKLADNTYATMWSSQGSTPNFPERQVRLKRYVIFNPTSQQVAVTVSFTQATGGSWKAYETWTRYRGREPGSTTLNNPAAATAFTLDGFVFHQVTYWSLTGTPYTNVETAPFPCGSTSSGDAMHPMGNNAVKYVCSTAVPVAPILDASSEGVFSAADVSASVYRVAAELGGQERLPDTDNAGTMYLVPAATGTVPGTLVVYVTRPLAASRTRALRWNLAVAPPIATPAVDHYQTWDWEYFNWSGSWFPPYVDFTALRVGEYLAASRETLAGSLGLTTKPCGAGLLAGEAVARGHIALDGQTMAAH